MVLYPASAAQWTGHWLPAIALFLLLTAMVRHSFPRMLSIDIPACLAVSEGQDTLNTQHHSLMTSRVEYPCQDGALQSVHTMLHTSLCKALCSCQDMLARIPYLICSLRWHRSVRRDV